MRKLIALSGLVAVTALTATSTAQASSTHRAISCRHLTPHKELVCARKNLHLARQSIKLSISQLISTNIDIVLINTGHSIGYWRWQERVAKHQIKVAKHRIHRQQYLELLSRGGTALKIYAFRTDPCLATITNDYENSSWDPTRSYGGYGNTSLAYGIPQAYPGTKLAYWAYTIPTMHQYAGQPTGSDWATNALLQWHWMKNYAVGRYGSSCAALHSRIYSNSY